jgi:hypothetical protein
MAHQKRKLNLYRVRNKWKNIISDIQNSINVFESVIQEFASQDIDLTDRYDVRVYSTIPTCSCVFNDDYLNIAYYDEQEPGSISPAWVYRKTTTKRGLYNYYQANFETIWKDAISIFDPDYDLKVMEVCRQELASYETANSFLRPSHSE